MKEVADDTYASIYGYDAGGERTVKFTGTNEWVDVNGSAQGFASLHNLTLYTSPYLVASQKGYTKHYYIENQRIASKLGNGGLQDLDNANQTMTVEEKEKRSAKVKAFKTGLSNTAQCLNLKHFDFVFKTNCPPPPNAAKFEPCLFQYMAVLEEKEPDRYFYHPDHLGSASWITDAGGKPIQHLGYLPFGEEFVDQRTSDWSAAYKFTGKEKDGETGYNYFGARYYMSDLGIWASVDPLSDMYPSTSAYTYCDNNPTRFIDPDGRKWEDGVEDQRKADDLTQKAKNGITIKQKELSYLSGQKTTKSNQNRINDLKEEIGYLEEGIAALKNMGEDEKNIFHFEKVSGNTGHVRKREDGVFNIEYINDAIAWHETVHLNDYLTDSRGWAFDSQGLLGTNKAAYSTLREAIITHNKREIKAYKSQFSFDGGASMLYFNGTKCNSLSDVRDWMIFYKYLQPLPSNN